MKFYPINKKRFSGFTLIELLVVIAIIGLISSIVFASLSTARKKARDARRMSDLKQIQNAIEMYLNEYSKLPRPYPDYLIVGTDTDISPWDTSYQGNFMEFLTHSIGSANPNNINFMSNIPLDPINNGNVTASCDAWGSGDYYHYCYTYFGGASSLYVLATRLESTGLPYQIVGQ